MARHLWLRKRKKIVQHTVTMQISVLTVLVVILCSARRSVITPNSVRLSCNLHHHAFKPRTNGSSGQSLSIGVEVMQQYQLEP
ncbi:uncharacterized protein METZ01_LOCUS361753 [marine metagenome]|uniref:Uncharacterized protein n=1 Tax=marine metagenome TaxID=408172 RepID=A0A382SGA7_9ZZZZ